jgi:Putative transcriptional regulator
MEDDMMEDEYDMHNLVARNVDKLPLVPSSCYLQPGTFLVAHPLMTGCFAKSVICLLQHTPASSDVSSTKNTNNQQDQSASGEPGTIGGTYGLIVNQPIKTGVPNNSNSERSRWRTLREVIRYDCLPEGIKVAFGDSPVRNGGPVNLSVQMLRYTGPEEEEKSKIGGSVLPMATLRENDEDVPSDVTISSAAMDTNSAVYFGGDIIKAAQAVIDGDIKKDSFSFLIGASCWESGQLESEVEKGYWIPCSAPPEIAFSGLCNLKDIHDVQTSESSLWVSMMAAIGEEEGRLAQVFEDVEYDENAYPCDEV